MKELYNDLMALCTDEARFFYRDDTTPAGTHFRTFSYHYASYEDWLQPGALECRGIMFELINGEPVRIAARPMEKFFNLNETPFTMNLDLTKAQYMMAKEDGSLVSTYLDGDILRFKSKTSIKSEQALAANAMLMDVRNEALVHSLLELAQAGFTANFEYVAPTNRIVLDYPEKALILLNVRYNDTGEYIPYDDLISDGVLRQYLVQAFEVPEGDFVKEIKARTGIEGFVFMMDDGLHFKLKTDWYCALHHTKDSINAPDRLFDSIVNNASDDLKAMFSDDATAVAKINQFEAIYMSYLHNALELIHGFYNSNRGKDRKTYAGDAQVACNKVGLGFLFSIVMKAYGGQLDDDTMLTKVNELFMKNVKTFIPKEYI